MNNSALKIPLWDKLLTQQVTFGWDLAVEGAFDGLKAPVLRVALPDCPAPASRTLEAAYFPRSGKVFEKAKELLAWKRRAP